MALVPFNRNRVSTKNSGFEDFYNMLDDFFTDPWFSNRKLANETFRLDVKDLEDAYLIEAELPGVNRDEIKLDFNQDHLVIKVEREENQEEKEENYLHRERRYCAMQRVVYLEDVDKEKIKAKLTDGVLSINVPKLENQIKSYEIEIE